MSLKDSVVSWYLRNILMKKVEDITNPGFIITHASLGVSLVNLREVALPETLISELERRITSACGIDGERRLYSAGKKFGYVYASLSGLPTVDKTSEKDLLEAANLFVGYISGTWATEACHRIDLSTKTFELVMKNFVVCKTNGMGYLMTEGGFLVFGLMSSATQQWSVYS